MVMTTLDFTNLSGTEMDSREREEIPISKESKRLPGLANDLLAFYVNQKYTDCTLMVSDGQVLAHKFMLMARSSIFFAMFADGRVEELNGVAVIHVKDDIEIAVLDNFLKYIYSDQIHGLNTETAVSMYGLAAEYNVLGLRDHCLNFLKNNITLGNVRDVAVLARSHGDTELEEKVSLFIQNHMEDIPQSDVWKNFMIAKPSITSKL